MPKKESKATKAERERERGQAMKGKAAKEEKGKERKGKREGEKEQKERETRLDGRNDRFCYCARWAPIPDTTT